MVPGGGLTTTDLLATLGVALLLVLALLASVARMMHFSRTTGADGPGPDEKTNCPACGARVVAARAECSYCGEPLGDQPGGAAG